MNIIEQHYLQKNNYTRHFFKVNTNDDISLQMQSKFANHIAREEINQNGKSGINSSHIGSVNNKRKVNDGTLNIKLKKRNKEKY